MGVEALKTLISAEAPAVSWVGIGLSITALLAMPPLAIAKARIGEKLGSSATKSEGQQNMLCAYVSAALLIGLGANALFGLWWADPLTALLIAGVAVKEGREAWQGESCCTAVIPDGSSTRCEEACCN
jgi:divalent metal cation (Fe/Co/Zn/Cd) transporter